MMRHESLCKWSELWSGGMGKKKYIEVFGHIERINSEEFVKKVYVSEIEGPNRRGRPLGRWKDRVKVYRNISFNRTHI